MRTLGVWLTRLLALIGGLVVLLLITFFMAIKRGSIPSATLEPKPMVLTLYLDQPMPDFIDHSSLSGILRPDALSLADFEETLIHAAKDPNVKSIILYASGASMGLAQAQEIRSAIKRFQESGKKVFAHADTFGELTGGTLPYYLASVADEIWLQPMGSVMLTGFAMEIPFVKDLLDKVDAQARFAKREEYKSMPDTLTESGLSPANREANQELLAGLSQQVLAEIATDRGLASDAVEAYVARMPITGEKEPLEAGLVDKIAYADELESKALETAGKDAELVDLNDYWRHEAKGKNKTKANQAIAVIYGEGIIMSDQGSDQGFNDEPIFSGEYMKEAMDQVLKSSNVKAIVFRVNSGGGSPVVSETIWRQIRRAQAAKIPVIASMGDMAASGGYWVLTHADKIVANPATITGSIGVFSGKVVLEGLMKKIGVNWEHITTAPHAGMWSANRDFTPEQWQKLQASIDQTYQMFVTRVAEGRRLNLDHVKQISKGRVWTGEQAQKFGLVDALGGMHTALQMAKEAAKISAVENVEVVVYPRSIPFYQRLKLMFSSSASVMHKFSNAWTLCRAYWSMGVTGSPTTLVEPMVIR
ncbi:MAG: signal peptide peptidase SppA [Holosporales bacterium]